MVKPELGTKRVCMECSTRYFDLNRQPIACPKCGAVFEITSHNKTRPADAKPEKAVAKDASPEPSAVAENPDDNTDVADDGDGEAEIISLDEAEKADGDDDDDDDAVAVLPDTDPVIGEDGNI